MMEMTSKSGPTVDSSRATMTLTTKSWRNFKVLESQTTPDGTKEGSQITAATMRGMMRPDPTRLTREVSKRCTVSPHSGGYFRTYGNQWSDLVIPRSNSEANAVYRTKPVQHSHDMLIGTQDIRNDANWTNAKQSRFWIDWPRVAVVRPP